MYNKCTALYIYALSVHFQTTCILLYLTARRLRHRRYVNNGNVVTIQRPPF